MLNVVAPDVWEISRPMKAPGLRAGHRMTVVRVGPEDLWIHSPVAWDIALDEALENLGAARYFVAPSRYHDLYWLDWFQNFSGSTFSCAPGVKEEHAHLPFQRVLTDGAADPWEPQLQKVFIAGMPKVNEFVFFHPASRSLIVADLVFNFSRDQNLLGKLFLMVNDAYGRVAISRLFRSCIKDREAFKQSMQRILEWDFERIIMGHGAIVERDGKQVLRKALAWLT
ncbi:MAG: DUF4336 domain-containing protein [Verrucomicrobiota bacterium]